MNRFVLVRRRDGRWGWRLLAGNNQIIATDGGQGYENRGDCSRIGLAIVHGLYAPAGAAVLEEPDVIEAEAVDEGAPETSPAPAVPTPVKVAKAARRVDRSIRS